MSGGHALVGCQVENPAQCHMHKTPAARLRQSFVHVASRWHGIETGRHELDDN
jgi:hypothetical protein